jgi:hypothetical protein
MRHSLIVGLIVSFLLAGLCTAQVTVNTFEGIDASQITSAGLGIDPNGAVGTKQYMEWADVSYQGFNKTTGAWVYASGPVPGDTPWRTNNMPDCYGPSGNVQLNFDHIASRWVIGRRQSGSGAYFYCIAVSNTDDLSASNFAWYTYELPLNSVLGTNSHGHVFYPDYPKIGTWIDGYYVTIDLEDPDNGFAEVGVVACAFDRTTMLTGGTMRKPQCFRYPNPPNGIFRAHSLEPADIDGLIAPQLGTPEYFASLQNPAQGQSTANNMNEWVFKVNWATPTNSTFTGPISVGVGTYTQGCFNINNVTNTVCVPEPSSSVTHNYIDSVGDRLMQRLAYRRYTGANAYQSWLVSTTVQVGSTPLSQTGVRFYELRDKGTGNVGTITANDSNYRFMPSIAQDKVGNMAVGYSVSGTSTHPSIAASYLNLQQRTAATEIDLWNGTADEENAFTWGVYTSMTVDPVDDCTFWYVNEYFDTNQVGSAVDWQTRIANFKLPNCH